MNFIKHKMITIVQHKSYTKNYLLQILRLINYKNNYNRLFTKNLNVQ